MRCPHPELLVLQVAWSLARIPGAPEVIRLWDDARSPASQVFSKPISTDFSGSEFRRGSLGRLALRVCAPSSSVWGQVPGTITPAGPDSGVTPDLAPQLLAWNHRQLCF